MRNQNTGDDVLSFVLLVMSVPGADLVMSPDDAIAAWMSREFVGTSWRSFDVSEHESLTDKPPLGH